MYTPDVTGAHILLTYSDIYADDKPNLIESIKGLNMHKSISIICELLRVRDSYMEPVRTIGGEFKIPFETILKRDMCDIVPKSAEDMRANPLLYRNNHIISVQMLFMLLKKIIVHGNYETMEQTDYQIEIEDYKTIIKLQLLVAEEISEKHKKEMDIDHFLYSTYHLNYQRNIANEFLRMYYMMEIVSRDINAFDADVQRQYRDYYKDFTDKYGFTPTEYSSLLFWQLEEYYSGINGLAYAPIWKSVEKSYGESEISGGANRVITTLSKLLVDYKQWAEESEDREWDFSEFFAAPFIKDTSGRFISLSDITLRNAFFEKMFWLIRDCYPVEDSRAMAFFGRLYEKYIQDITEDAANEEFFYIDEFVYTDGRVEKKSSDAYIRKGNDLLVVEAKGFSVLLNCMTKNENVEVNNDKLFVKPILQADKSLAIVMDEKPEFAGVETAYIVSVTMDNINAVPNYYNAIHKEIMDKKRSDKVKYFFNFSIEEYEMLMALMERQIDIFILLKEYYENDKLKPFSTYLHDRYTDIGMTTFMEKCFKEASDTMKEILFGADSL